MSPAMVKRLDLCRLCGRPEVLQRSHVLPAFVFKWLKETSATGYLRSTQAMNKRVQDGIKEKWLCTECETRLSVWETQFASTLFHPLNADGGQKIPYSSWLLKFCIS